MSRYVTLCHAMWKINCEHTDFQKLSHLNFPFIFPIWTEKWQMICDRERFLALKIFMLFQSFTNGLCFNISQLLFVVTTEEADVGMIWVIVSDNQYQYNEIKWK